MCNTSQEMAQSLNECCTPYSKNFVLVIEREKTPNCLCKLFLNIHSPRERSLSATASLGLFQWFRWRCMQSRQCNTIAFSF